MEKGGASLFGYYLSMQELLRDVYPEFDWDPIKFVEAGRVPAGFFEYPQNQKLFLEHIGNQLGVNKVTSLFCLSFFRLMLIFGSCRTGIQ